jgi:molecular chaperone DnaK
MRYGVGIDLGTSFTSAAIREPGVTRMVPLSPKLVVPSVVHRTPDGTLLTGKAALAATADPTQLVWGFKRRLGDPTPLLLNGIPYSATTLMAAQLRDVLSAVTAMTGTAPAEVVLTCPAIWGRYRREAFGRVVEQAGASNVRLVTEPEAAATHYSAERTLGDGQVVAVYDLGGGTFDTTILRMRAGGMEILGRPEGIEHLGGMDFDRALLGLVNDRLDGAISDLSGPEGAVALAQVRTACQLAKETLSTEPEVSIAVPLPDRPRPVTVTRVEFEELIRPSLQLTVEALRRTATSAGVRLGDLSAILLAGGSSRVPLVPRMISEESGKPVRATLHPKFTVALGAALRTSRPAEVFEVARQTSPVRQPCAARPVLVPAGAPAFAPSARRWWHPSGWTRG